jgi:hypothetical protein
MYRVVIFMTIWNIVRPFGILHTHRAICGNLVIFPVLVCLDREKSGNPENNDQAEWHSDIVSAPEQMIRVRIPPKEKFLYNFTKLLIKIYLICPFVS